MKSYRLPFRVVDQLEALAITNGKTKTAVIIELIKVASREKSNELQKEAD